MKLFLLIYSEDRDYICDPSFGPYKGRTILVEKSYPSGTTDFEIAEYAHSLEFTDRLEGMNFASENRSTRTLVKIVAVARELPLFP